MWKRQDYAQPACTWYCHVPALPHPMLDCSPTEPKSSMPSGAASSPTSMLPPPMPGLQGKRGRREKGREGYGKGGNTHQAFRRRRKDGGKLKGTSNDEKCNVHPDPGRSMSPLNGAQCRSKLSRGINPVSPSCGSSTARECVPLHQPLHSVTQSVWLLTFSPHSPCPTFVALLPPRILGASHRVVGPWARAETQARDQHRRQCC